MQLDVHSNLPIGKSTAAFLLSAKRLFASGPVYFWTLTFVEVPHDDEWAMRQYWRLMKGLQDEYNNMLCGLRVVELHKSHGIHFHMLVNKRIDIHHVFRIGKPLGFGRVEVDVCDVETAGYLAKYLTKRDRRLPGSMRRWAAFGPWAAVKVRDLELDCAGANNLRKITAGGKCDYMAAQVIFFYSNILGDIENWGEKHKRRVFERLGVVNWPPYEKYRLSKVFGWDRTGIDRDSPNRPF